MSGNDALRALAGGEIVPKHDARAVFGRRRDFKLERRAGMPVPDFGGVDAMPMRTLAARQEKIDRGREPPGRRPPFCYPETFGGSDRLPDAA